MLLVVVGAVAVYSSQSILGTLGLPHPLLPPPFTRVASYRQLHLPPTHAVPPVAPLCPLRLLLGQFHPLDQTNLG
jgi:hypothetical protein